MSSTLQQTRFRRQQRVRARVRGTSARPRLSVFRSNKGVYAQVIDDSRGVTLASASDISSKKRGTLASATEVGTAVAAAAKAAGVNTVVFDRSGYAYHGQVAALADAARAAGLVF